MWPFLPSTLQYLPKVLGQGEHLFKAHTSQRRKVNLSIRAFSTWKIYTFGGNISHKANNRSTLAAACAVSFKSSFHIDFVSRKELPSKDKDIFLLRGKGIYVYWILETPVRAFTRRRYRARVGDNTITIVTKVTTVRRFLLFQFQD